MIFDIGHGAGSFDFGVADAMLAGGFPPDIISSDVHVLCIDGPAFDNMVTMSKFLMLGMPVPDIVRAVTLAPAKALGRPDLGDLAVGSTGDATVVRIEDGSFPMTDVSGVTRTARQRSETQRVLPSLRKTSDSKSLTAPFSWMSAANSARRPGFT